MVDSQTQLVSYENVPDGHFSYRGETIPDLAMPWRGMTLGGFLATLPADDRGHRVDIDFGREYTTEEVAKLVGRHWSRISPRITPYINAGLDGVRTEVRKKWFTGPRALSMYFITGAYDSPASLVDVVETPPIAVAQTIPRMESEMVSFEDAPEGKFRYGLGLRHVIDDRKVQGKYLLSALIARLEPDASEHRPLQVLDYTPGSEYTFRDLAKILNVQPQTVKKRTLMERKKTVIPGLTVGAGSLESQLTGSAAAQVIMASPNLVTQLMDPENFVLSEMLGYQRAWLGERDGGAFKLLSDWVLETYSQLAQSFFSSKHDSDNALQEVLIKLSEKDLPDMTDHQMFRYVRAMVKNQSLDLITARKSPTATGSTFQKGAFCIDNDGVTGDDGGAVSEIGWEAFAYSTEQIQHLDEHDTLGRMGTEECTTDLSEVVPRVLSTLRPKDQEIVQAVFYGGLSYRKAAAHLGYGLSDIKISMRRAFEVLRWGPMRELYEEQLD